MSDRRYRLLGSAGMSEPRTEAGKAYMRGETRRYMLDLILAIEEQAAAEARRELLAKVEEAETYYRSFCGWCKAHPERPCDNHQRVAVWSDELRALLDPSR